MCACGCVRVHTVCTCARVRARVWVGVGTHACVCGYVCAHTCVDVHARMCSLWTCVCVHMCVRGCACVQMCVHVSTRVCRRTHYPWRSTLQWVPKEGHMFLGTELFLKASSVPGRLVPIRDTHPRADPCFLCTHTPDVCTEPCTLRLAAQCGLRGEGQGRGPSFFILNSVSPSGKSSRLGWTSGSQ